MKRRLKFGGDSMWLFAGLSGLVRKALLFGLFAAVMATVPKAKADLLIEPYLGYGIGELTAAYSNGSGNLKYDVGGVNIGARVAYALPIFYFGLDYDLGISHATLDSNPDNTFSSTNMTRSALFAFAGVHLPLIRLWLGYGFLDSLNFASASGDSNGKFGGSAVKFGLGFTGLPFVDLNLEYIATTYNKYTNGSTESISSGNTFKSASDGTLMLSASLPLQF